MTREKFISSVRSKGDLAGVLECDGETEYFYLYSLGAPNRNSILGAISLNGEVTYIHESELFVRWNKQETKVGLFHHDNLLAMFNSGKNADIASGVLTASSADAKLFDS